ncbi:MAG: histidine phosphatase family protein [Clostridia bacterium]|nr:histidine phosphatase family protein [Clostridia bacterium]
MLFYFVRHGDPIYDPDQLTPLGQRQAEAVARRITLQGVNKIFASTSTRAYQTSLPTSEICKKPVTKLDWCNESHAWDQLCVDKPDGGRTWAFRNPPTAQLFVSNELRALGDKWYTHPEIEKFHLEKGLERIQNEADQFFFELGYEHLRDKNLYKAVRPNEDRVALFAHEGFGAAFLSCVLDIPYPQFSVHFGLTHSSLTVIEFKEVNGYVIPLVLTSGNDAHLYHEHLLTGYQNRIRY